MKTNVLTVLFALYFALSAAFAQANEAPLYYVNYPQTTSTFPYVIFVSGSKCVSSFKMFKEQIYLSAKWQAAIAVVEKPGLQQASTACPDSYMKNNTVEKRVEDHLSVVNVLKNHPNWDGRIFWVGESEGGVVVSLAAPKVLESSGAVLLASGGGIPLSDELVLLTKKFKHSFPNNEALIKQKINEIENEPTPQKKWLGFTNTYKWWASFFRVRPLDSLLMSEFPIYLAAGGKDTNVPIESADAISDAFRLANKENLIYMRYENLDHSWKNEKSKTSHSSQVLGHAFTWLHKQIKPTERLVARNGMSVH